MAEGHTVSCHLKFYRPTPFISSMNDSLHIVCPHCNAVNRIPPDRMESKPKCGNCREQIFIGQPVAMDLLSFEKHISRNDIPILVDFWAEWCGPCKMMAPQFASAAGELEPNVRLVKVDTESEQSLGARFGIRSIPTLMMFMGGNEVARQSGAMSATDIVSWSKSII